MDKELFKVVSETPRPSLNVWEVSPIFNVPVKETFSLDLGP